MGTDDTFEGFSRLPITYGPHTEERTLARERGLDEIARGEYVRPVRSRVVRPMRGQVVIREIKDPATVRGVWRPAANPRDVKIHRGTVLALGAPMLTTKGAEVPHGFGVGDIVLFSFVHNEKAFTYAWTDGQPATWIPQWAVSAVVESVGLY